MTQKKYWIGQPPSTDDFGLPITDTFYDGKTRIGPWAFMSPISWPKYGIGKTGLGLAQKYQRQSDGRWLKTEG
jgi:hypothetical protein